MWAPALKLGATPNSRRFHFPVESIYSAIEIKQSLSFAQLDAAMEKLVQMSRLTRPNVTYGQVTENQHFLDLDRNGWILNPLHTAIVATGLQDGVKFNDLAHRFGAINAMLERNAMVTELCGLDTGSTWYVASNSEGGRAVADFMRDEVRSLSQGIFEREPDKVFYYFIVRLLGHLNRSMMKLGEIPDVYGPGYPPSVEHLEWANAAYNRD